jgi:hypothetical protein
LREGIALDVVSPAADPTTRYSGYPVEAGLDGPLFSARCTHLLSVLGCASPAVVNQALAKSAPGLGPSGFHPHAFARTGLRALLASGLRPAHRPAGRFAAHPRSPGGSSSSFGSERPNGLSAAAPCLQRAFAAYPRSQAPSGIPRPIARGPALDSPGLPRPTDADEQTTTGSALQGEGVLLRPLRERAEKRLFTARNTQPRSSPGKRRRQVERIISRTRKEEYLVK